MSYSDIVMDHFYSPRNQRRMESPDVTGVCGDPRSGNFMVLYLRVKDDRIVEATYQTHGCCPAIAAGSLLTVGLQGVSSEEARGWTEPAINDALGGLPLHRRYCSGLAAAALESALERWNQLKASKIGQEDSA